MSDANVAVGLVVAVASTLIATTYGLLPDRIDLSEVFAAYGGGTIIGELLGTWRDARAPGRRWGVTLIAFAAVHLVTGWLAG